jgi:hypothetical protein
MTLSRDNLLIESMRVRRRRMRHAFLFGDVRSRRELVEPFRRIVAGLVVAAVVGAACVTASFLVTHRHDWSGSTVGSTR